LFSHQSDEITVNKPGIVFVHGIWADGSSSRPMPTKRRRASSDVPMLSNPSLVLDVIRKAAAAVEKS